VEAVSNCAAVLNANDPWYGNGEACPGDVVFFAIHPEHPVVVNHRAGGGEP